MRDHVLERLRGSLGLSHAGRGEVSQTSGAGRLFQGDYSASTTVGDEFGRSRLGLGVMRDLEGEIVSVKGTTWCVPVDGQPREVDPSEGIAFGIAAHGGVKHVVPMTEGSIFEEILAGIDAYLESTHLDHEAVVCAIEIVGTFTDVMLRTVAPPTYLNESLMEVIEDETRFEFDVWSGTLVGFRFPDTSNGDLIPGLHLHAIAKDLLSGGHVRLARTDNVKVNVWVDELHPLA